MDEKRARKPAKLGPVAEGQLELNRELTRRAPEASRDHLLQEQEALQRAQPHVVHEAARVAGRQYAAGGPAPQDRTPSEPPTMPDAPATAPEGPPEGAGAGAPNVPARSPFADAATATRDPRSDAG